jgi:hypothetical protein
VTDRTPVWSDEHWRLSPLGESALPLILTLESIAHSDLADLPGDRAAELGLLTTRGQLHWPLEPHRPFRSPRTSPPRAMITKAFILAKENTLISTKILRDHGRTPSR